MVDPSVVTAVRNYLRTLQSYGIVVSFGVVFGSWVTGKPISLSEETEVAHA